jgi:hypothetical protein
MNVKVKILVAALALGGSISAASAGGVITGVTVNDDTGGTFKVNLGANPNVLDISKAFTGLDPISLTFTVGHTNGGPGNPYVVTESITNSTGQTWLDYHFSITEPTTGGQGVVFTNFNNSTLSGFTLDSAPSSGPRNLNFTGELAHDGVATATFSLSPFDPGAGNTATFTLAQVPTIPEPETYAMLLAGLAVMGFMAKRTKGKENA